MINHFSHTDNEDRTPTLSETTSSDEGLISSATEQVIIGTTPLLDPITDNNTPLDYKNDVTTRAETITSASGKTNDIMIPAQTTTAAVTVAGVTQNVQVGIDYTGQIRITNKPWDVDLLDTTSEEYKDLESQLLSLVSL